MFRSLFLLFLAGTLFGADARIGLLPFADQSTYKGHWKLRSDIPRYIEGCLSETYAVVAHDSLYEFCKDNKLTPGKLRKPGRQQQVAGRFNVDWLISGTIKTFSVRKIVVGEGKYGGMKNYKAHIVLTIKIYNRGDNAFSLTRDIEIKKTENLTAVNLGRLSKDEERFDMLRTEKFGSVVFNKSVAGTAMKEVCEKVFGAVQALPQTVSRKGETKKLIKIAKIVHIEGDEFYINAGFDDKVAIGDVYQVFTPGDSIKDPDSGAFLGMAEKYAGQIRITFVKASHLSHGKAEKVQVPFKLKDRIRVEK